LSHSTLLTRFARRRYDFVLHNGDISYARGDDGIWDEWFDLLQPAMQSTPYMVTPGNHDLLHSDSGGEDGIPCVRPYSPSAPTVSGASATSPAAGVGSGFLPPTTLRLPASAALEHRLSFLPPTKSRGMRPPQPSASLGSGAKGFTGRGARASLVVGGSPPDNPRRWRSA
jgi:hypothetical protein